MGEIVDRSKISSLPAAVIIGLTKSFAARETAEAFSFLATA
eukprot:CAMPEP_0113956738 /NCGR_PEP_ID=MMETSP0011_2-20120614/2254_1 /TAXON_ID=101924 /ORGANISM="Rhodosorus marinus" /LENGTH=40 /DNA_ID=CAMNT_0000966969 /DNA_START=1022 /DNA_END=1144 /DNA_ORIENTATION=+ /assembly_acc=CAM_ASM_000156